MKNRWRKTLENFEANFEQEKKKAPKLANAWLRAERRYGNHFDELTQKEKRILGRKLPEDIPEDLKSKPEYLAKALLICTESPAFMTRFNKLTSEMLADEAGWQKYKFKCFFILSTLAVQFMPRGIVPPKRTVLFRGVEQNMEQLQPEGVLVMGTMVPFTTDRKLALNRKV